MKVKKEMLSSWMQSVNEIVSWGLKKGICDITEKTSDPS